MIDEAIKKMQSLKPRNYKGLKNFTVQEDIELNVEHFLAHGKLILTVRLDELIIKLSSEAIKFFKHEDYHDLQQEELSSTDISGLEQIPSLPINEENYDEILYAKPEENLNTLDNFVNIKSIKMKEKPVNYPKLNKHNLKDENLKYKGIKRKSDIKMELKNKNKNKNI